MPDQLTRRSVAAGGLLLLTAGSALAKIGHIRRDLYGWEGEDPTIEPGLGTIPSVARFTHTADTPGDPFILSGRVTSWDRNLPVANVIIAAYHTDPAGKYGWLKEKGARRIRQRGWAKTDADGRYIFHSIKPGPYPTRTDPAHVHMTVFEPGHRPYWIDSAVFLSEFGVTKRYVERQPLRGGSGVVRLTRSRGIWQGARDIRLERHTG